MASSDPFRDDAAAVFRALRDSGDVALSAMDLADRAFPIPFGHDDPLYPRLIKRGLRRVFDSLVWMRHEGVTLTAIPSSEGETRFVLGHVAVAVTPFVREKPEMVVVARDAAPVTAKVSQEPSPVGLSEAQDIWHGK